VLICMEGLIPIGGAFLLLHGYGVCRLLLVA